MPIKPSCRVRASVSLTELSTHCKDLVIMYILYVNTALDRGPKEIIQNIKDVFKSLCIYNLAINLILLRETYLIRVIYKSSCLFKLG